MPETITFHVARPPAEVFPWIADLERAPEWVPDVLSMEKLTPGAVGVGTRYREVVRTGRRTSTAELEVVEHEPDRVFAHRGRGGPARFRGRFVLEPADGGTRVVHEYDVRMTGAFRLLQPLTRRWVRGNAEAAVARLKRAIEGR